MVRAAGIDIRTEQVFSVGNNIMVMISMLPNYRMGYHLCMCARARITKVPAKVNRGYSAKDALWYYEIGSSTLFAAFFDNQLTAPQMGMSTQLLFTTIVTLMKVAILLTYLRKFSDTRISITLGS
jgi:hypothetical protein